MQIDVSNTLIVKEPSVLMEKWCQDNLTIPNPEYAKKARMGFWTGNTPKTLSLYEKRGGDLVLPFGTLRALPRELVQDTHFESCFKPSVAIDYGENVPLYPYQQKAVDEVYRAQYGILRSPAGSGKTQMGIALVKKFGKRALWLTHTLDLLKQSKERAERYMNKDLIGVITGGKVNIGRGITFATIQTMSKLDLSQYKDYFDVIIVDECHRCAGTPTSMTMFSKVLNSLAARHKIGLSATVHRSDGMIIATYALLGQIVYTVPDEAVKDTVMKVGIYPIGTDVEISREALNTDGTLNYTKLINYLSENTARNEVILAALVENREHAGLVLSDRIGHLEALIKALPPDMQKNAAIVTGKMTTKAGKAEREQAIEDMRTGRKKYLFATYNLCKEGLDIPCLERLYMTTPVKDYAVVVQSIGRIARKCQGKESAICYDFVDDMIYTVRAYKQRLRHYKKAGAYLCNG